MFVELGGVCVTIYSKTTLDHDYHGSSYWPYCEYGVESP